MEYYKLPVYHAAIEFLKQLNIHTNKISREGRFFYVHPMNKLIFDVMRNIAKSNNDVNDQKYIESSIEIIKDIQIDLRGWFELGMLHYKGFSILSDRSEKILKQLIGWKKSRVTINNTNTNNTNKII